MHPTHVPPALRASASIASQCLATRMRRTFAGMSRAGLLALPTAPLLGALLACSGAEEDPFDFPPSPRSSPPPMQTGRQSNPGAASAAPAAQSTPENDPELVELRRTVAPGAALLRDSARSPATVRAAEIEFRARLTDADAHSFLSLYARASAVLEGSAELEDFQPPAGTQQLLARYADIPYLGQLLNSPSPGSSPPAMPSRPSAPSSAPSANRAASEVEPSELGQLHAALIQLPFTPQCSPSCAAQTVLATVQAVSYDLLLEDGLKSLARGIPGAETALTLVKECIVDNADQRCTVEDYERFAAELGLKTAVLLTAPELAVAITAYELGKLVYEVSAFHMNNVRACRAHQESPACCSEPLSKCGGVCCQGFESCCNGTCIAAELECAAPRSAAPPSPPVPSLPPAPSGGGRCCDTDTLFSACSTLEGPPGYEVDCAASPGLQAPDGCTPLPAGGGFLYCCPTRIGRDC